MFKSLALCTLPLLAATAACGDDGGGSSDDTFKANVTASMHDSIQADLADSVQAAKDLQTAAPTHAWTAADAAAITAMRTAWKKTRVGYEHVEGATAPIFPDLDVSMDERYDGFLADLGATGDANLFDDQGVTGMHAIERILYAPDIRPEVIDFESTLPGYKAAAYPATDAEAMEFKTKLCQKLIDDTQSLHDQWTPAKIDVGAAFQGLVGLMNEQKEKVNLAASGEEESRYANVTLFDLRNNLEGTTKIYAYFSPWILSKDGGDDPDGMITARFADLKALYNGTTGDALPDVPATWSSDNPSSTDLMTPFGKIWEKVHEEVDPTADGSVVFEMNEAAVLLGFPEFVEE